MVTRPRANHPEADLDAPKSEPPPRTDDPGGGFPLPSYPTLIRLGINMASSNRTDADHQDAQNPRKTFQPVTPVERPVLEHLLYACCLEDARYEVADECFARLQESFFDWNEVRVTTVRELSEIMRGLPDPPRSANLLKQTLHAVFEAVYEFDLEPLRKQNLGVGRQAAKPIPGHQSVHGGLCRSERTGWSLDPALPRLAERDVHCRRQTSESELKKGLVPGLERAIPKTKGMDFASLLHQMGAELISSPFNTQVRSILLEIAPDAKTRLPRRGGAERGRAQESRGRRFEKNAEAENGLEGRRDQEDRQADNGQEKEEARSHPNEEGQRQEDNRLQDPFAKGGKAGKKSTSKQLARRKPR